MYYTCNTDSKSSFFVDLNHFFLPDLVTADLFCYLKKLFFKLI